MRISIHYRDLAKRTTIIKQYEAQKTSRSFNIVGTTRDTKLRMLTDNFDPDWIRGTEPHGIMTFTDEPEERVEPRRNLAAELEVKVAELEARIAQLEGG